MLVVLAWRWMEWHHFPGRNRFVYCTTIVLYYRISQFTSLSPIMTVIPLAARICSGIVKPPNFNRITSTAHCIEPTYAITTNQHNMLMGSCFSTTYLNTFNYYTWWFEQSERHFSEWTSLLDTGSPRPFQATTLSSPQLKLYACL